MTDFCTSACQIPHRMFPPLTTIQRTYGYFNSKFRMLAYANEDNATSAETENTASARSRVAVRRAVVTDQHSVTQTVGLIA